MTEENLEEIELTPAEDNHWYWLMLTTTFLDKGQTPNGWHWFVALHCLLNFDFKAEQAELPDKHPLKSKELSLEATKNTLIDIISEFKNTIKLKKIGVIDIINFSQLDFLNEMDFSNFIFPLQVSFGYSNFHKSVNFTRTSFYNRSIFSDVVFSDDVYFDETEFLSGLAFQNTTFFKEVYFRRAKFLGGTVFNDAKFLDVSGCAHFNEASFSNAMFFHNTTFYGKAFFHSVKFLSYTTFENTSFKIHAPRFYGAELNDEMFWTDIELPKFKSIDDKETTNNYKKRIKNNQNAYENLSTKLGNQNRYRDEHFFFRQEMNCQKELAESYTSRFAFWLYELFSDYGYRIGRAFWWWVGHIALGVLVITFIAMCGGVRYHENLPCAISVSFANANPYAFFGFESSSLKACYTELDKIAPISFAIIKAIQTVLGIALLFLVVLTLRVRFRLK